MLDPPTGGALTMTSTYQTRCTVTVGLLHRHRSGHFPFSVQFNSHLFLSPIGARTPKMPAPYLPPNVEG